MVDWPERPGQLPAYRHFIDRFAYAFEWAAFIDLDEFLVPTRDDSIAPCSGPGAISPPCWSTGDVSAPRVGKNRQAVS
ncbi:MAG: hypothetical protein EXR07_02525 [Acetobacteraceae bacterium]|nr:hypothetical protein [Acetobacteraceae bacterium]